MNCTSCGNPLHVVSGGDKSEVGSTQIITIHVWGCLNPQCEKKGQEQDRSYTTRDSFEG